MVLKVYSAKWCPHCQQTEKFLQQHQIPFEVINIETLTGSALQAVIVANGGEDWVVPTLEYNGKWRKGKLFNPKELLADLQNMGVVQPETNT